MDLDLSAIDIYCFIVIIVNDRNQVVAKTDFAVIRNKANDKLWNESISYGYYK